METSTTKPDAVNDSAKKRSFILGRFTIGAKLTLTLILIFCFTIVLIGFINYHISRQARESLFFSQLGIMAQTIKGDLLELIVSQRDRTASYTTDYYVRSEVESLVRPERLLSAEEESEMKRKISAYIKTQQLVLDTQIEHADIVSADGRTILTTTDVDDQYAHDFYPDLVKKISSADYGSGLYATYSENKKSGDGYMVYISPLYGFKYQEAPIAFYAIHFDNYKKVQEIVLSSSQSSPAEFKGYFSRNSKFETYLVDQNGTMIANSRYSPKETTGFKLKDFPVRNCQKNALESQGTYENYRKNRVLGVSTCLMGNWTLVAEIPEEYLFDNLQQLIKSLINFSALILIVTMAASYFLVQKIVQPIKQLVAASDKLSQGDLSTRVNIADQGDELTELGFVFNDMATKLESLYRNLENKVRERTWDLQKFKLAVENAAEHIIITDNNAHIIYANRAATMVTGYTFEEMKGQTPRLWGGNMPTEFYQKFWHTIKTDKKPFEGEVKNRRKDGEEYTALVHISPVLDEQNNVIFFVGIEQDITKLKEVDRMKTEFVSLASHQLRTPLTAIKWYLEMLLTGHEGELNSAQRELAENVNQSNERMITLVNALLNVSRLESGRIIIDPKETNLSALVQDIIDELKPQIVERNLHIVFNAQKDMKPINVDSKLLRNVYLNFLTNSIKYSKTSQTIQVDIFQEGNMIKSVIRDNGCGIALSEQPRIFEKFFRGTNALKVAPSGTGLGLYFAKGIIEALGGKLWFESVINTGTTFTFTIPATNGVQKAGEVTLA